MYAVIVNVLARVKSSPPTILRSLGIHLLFIKVRIDDRCLLYPSMICCMYQDTDPSFFSSESDHQRQPHSLQVSKKTETFQRLLDLESSEEPKKRERGEKKRKKVDMR